MERRAFRVHLLGKTFSETQAHRLDGWMRRITNLIGFKRLARGGEFLQREVSLARQPPSFCCLLCVRIALQKQTQLRKAEIVIAFVEKFLGIKKIVGGRRVLRERKTEKEKKEKANERDSGVAALPCAF